jgi:hypothetical protein
VLTQVEQTEALEQYTQLAINVEQLLQTFYETVIEISMHFVQTDKLEHYIQFVIAFTHGKHVLPAKPAPTVQLVHTVELEQVEQ